MAKQPKLPVVSGKEAVAAFKKDGWIAGRRVGSHVVMEKEGMRPTLSIPQHDELRPGTLHVLIKQAGLTVEQFRKLL